MTRDDTKRLLYTMSLAYPTYKVADEDLTATVDLWTVMLADDDPQAIERGLQWYIKHTNSAFAPSIGQLREATRQATALDNPTQMQAHELLTTLRKMTRNRSTLKEEYKRLPVLAQKVIGSPAVLSPLTLSPAEEADRQLRAICKTYAEKLKTAQLDADKELLEHAHKMIEEQKKGGK